MKKAESKSKTSKAVPSKAASASANKTIKQIPPAKKEKPPKTPIISKQPPSKVVPEIKTVPKRPRRPKRIEPKPGPPKESGRNVKPQPSKNQATPSAKFSKKDQKLKSKSAAQKLVQVVPAHRASHLSNIPVKKEKILMRFGKPTKRVLYKVDFLLKASPTIVYHFMTTPSCLVRWFCDAVDITGEFYTFSWRGNTELAELIDDIEDERLRFHWLDGEDEDEFFEFRISTADITDETILEIYDFAWFDEVDEQKQLWRTQVDRLRKETGDQ